MGEKSWVVFYCYSIRANLLAQHEPIVKKAAVDDYAWLKYIHKWWYDLLRWCRGHRGSQKQRGHQLSSALNGSPYEQLTPVLLVLGYVFLGGGLTISSSQLQFASDVAIITIMLCMATGHVLTSLHLPFQALWKSPHTSWCHEHSPQQKHDDVCQRYSEMVMIGFHMDMSEDFPGHLILEGPEKHVLTLEAHNILMIRKLYNPLIGSWQKTTHSLSPFKIHVFQLPVAW